MHFMYAAAAVWFNVLEAHLYERKRSIHKHTHIINMPFDRHVMLHGFKLYIMIL